MKMPCSGCAQKGSGCDSCEHKGAGNDKPKSGGIVNDEYAKLRDDKMRRGGAYKRSISRMNREVDDA